MSRAATWAIRSAVPLHAEAVPRGREARARLARARSPRRAGRGCPCRTCRGLKLSSRRRGGNSARKYSVMVADVVAQAGLGVDRARDDAFGHRPVGFRRALQRLRHVRDPDRKRRVGARLVGAERPRLVEADPRDPDHVRVVAAEPRVDVLVGRAGLAGEVGAIERQRARRGAGAHDILQERRHDPRVARVDRALGRRPRLDRVGLGEHVALGVDDPGDEIGRDPISAVGEDGVGAHHLHRRRRARAQRHRQVRRMELRVEAEPGDVVLRVLRPDRLHAREP